VESFKYLGSKKAKNGRVQEKIIGKIENLRQFHQLRGDILWN
jgi:hypothetical protein